MFLCRSRGLEGKATGCKGVPSGRVGWGCFGENSGGFGLGGCSLQKDPVLKTREVPGRTKRRVQHLLLPVGRPCLSPAVAGGRKITAGLPSEASARRRHLRHVRGCLCGCSGSQQRAEWGGGADVGASPPPSSPRGQGGPRIRPVPGCGCRRRWHLLVAPQGQPCSVPTGYRDGEGGLEPSLFKAFSNC